MTRLGSSNEDYPSFGEWEDETMAKRPSGAGAAAVPGGRAAQRSPPPQRAGR